MQTPLTREEVGDQASRLKLFYQLQFPDNATAHEPIEKLLQGLNVIPSLEKVITGAVAQHSLFQKLSSLQGDLLSQIQPVLSAVAEGRLDASLFRLMIKAMQRLDIAINRFDKAITAARTDVNELTGLLNRTAVDRDLKRESDHAQRMEKPLCLAKVDADHFKPVRWAMDPSWPKKLA